MTYVRDPTYILAPNWTFRPGGPVALGNIDADSLRPQHTLSKPEKDFPELETATENNWRLATEKIRSVSSSIWTRLFKQVCVGVDAKREKSERGKFVMKSLDTIYFKEDLSLEEIHERANEMRVKSILNADSLLFRRPVYMVTGFKIAKGFRLTNSDILDYWFSVVAAGAVAPEASLGAQVGAGSKRGINDGFGAPNDTVFAYQLMKVKPKGWGEKNQGLETEDLHHKEVFLSDGDEDEDEERY